MEDLDKLKNDLKASFEKIKKDMQKKDEEITALKKQLENIKNELIKKEELKEIIREALKEPKEKPNKAIEKDLVANYEKNKKNIIKNHILSTIIKNEMTKNELKELIVEKNNYCSKASFYRYLEELERENRINTVTINRKEVIVPAKMPKYL